MALPFLFCAVLAAAWPSTARAGDGLPDEDVIRSGRPGRTESPFTVGGGHLQLELEFADVANSSSVSGSVTQTTTTYGVAPFDFRIGVTDGLDLEVASDGYLTAATTSRTNAGTARASGFGDLSVRAKYGFWDEPDGGAAVIAFIKLPTASRAFGNGKFEGGMIVPFSVSVDETFAAGGMSEVDWRFDDTSARYRPQFVVSAVVNAAITTRFGLYAEAWGVRTTGPAAGWSSTAGVGAAYVLSKTVQLDAGINVGLGGEADAFGAFTGLSVRW